MSRGHVHTCHCVNNASLKYSNKEYASFCFCMKICNFAAYYIYISTYIKAEKRENKASNQGP